MYFNEQTIDRYIGEDAPYFDLTSLLLDIGDHQGTLRYITREKAVVSGVEVVVKIFEKLGIKIESYIASGTLVEADTNILQVYGAVEGLQMGWKISMNILEHCSGIATRTNKLVTLAKGIDSKIEIVTSRKIFPGTKELSIQGILDGGALPHRLGLSETVLIFKEHTNFLGGIDGLIPKIKGLKMRACEKRVIVEAETREEAINLCEAGVDGIQFDKIEPDVLKDIVIELREIRSDIILIAAGGINASNIEDYARTGVDSINTSWVYFGKPVDIRVEMNPVF
jgi:molybdenum transport protein